MILKREIGASSVTSTKITGIEPKTADLYEITSKLSFERAISKIMLSDELDHLKGRKPHYTRRSRLTITLHKKMLNLLEKFEPSLEDQFVGAILKLQEKHTLVRRPRSPSISTGWNRRPTRQKPVILKFPSPSKMQREFTSLTKTPS